LGLVFRCSVSAVHEKRAQLSKRLLHPPGTALGEDGLQVAFKQSAGVLEVLFGVGVGGGNAVKRFVEDADDALLFGQGRKRDTDIPQVTQVNHELNRAARVSPKGRDTIWRLEIITHELCAHATSKADQSNLPCDVRSDQVRWYNSDLTRPANERDQKFTASQQSASI